MVDYTLLSHGHGAASLRRFCAPQNKKRALRRVVSDTDNNQPFRQELINVLRSAPFSPFEVASALQFFILSCCLAGAIADMAAGLASALAAGAASDFKT